MKKSDVYLIISQIFVTGNLVLSGSSLGIIILTSAWLILSILVHWSE